MDGSLVGDLDGLCSGEQAAVNSVDNRLCSNLIATEESSVETLDSVFSALDAVKLQVYVALGIGI